MVTTIIMHPRRASEESATLRRLPRSRMRRLRAAAATAQEPWVPTHRVSRHAVLENGHGFADAAVRLTTSPQDLRVGLSSPVTFEDEDRLRGAMGGGSMRVKKWVAVGRRCLLRSKACSGTSGPASKACLASSRT